VSAETWLSAAAGVLEPAMKRSEINSLIEETLEFAGSCGFLLPPFARWAPEDWKTKGPEVDEIRDCMLGWDLTDFGSGNFPKVGLIMFTIRNGHLSDSRYTKPYCEKLLISGEGQVTPFHFHWSKSEDIINRGGGELAVRVYNSTPAEEFDDGDVTVSIDGIGRTVKAGGMVTLSPGESIFLPSGLYHEFWGVNGKVLLGEVSTVNDDTVDNRFHQRVGRFPEIEEDEEPRYLLFSEYPRA
jgi:D-lyxose ketol-isomerase